MQYPQQAPLRLQSVGQVHAAQRCGACSSCAAGPHTTVTVILCPAPHKSTQYESNAVAASEQHSIAGLCVSTWRCRVLQSASPCEQCSFTGHAKCSCMAVVGVGAKVRWVCSCPHKVLGPACMLWLWRKRCYACCSCCALLALHLKHTVPEVLQVWMYVPPRLVGTSSVTEGSEKDRGHSSVGMSATACAPAAAGGRQHQNAQLQSSG